MSKILVLMMAVTTFQTAYAYDPDSTIAPKVRPQVIESGLGAARSFGAAVAAPNSAAISKGVSATGAVLSAPATAPVAPAAAPKEKPLDMSVLTNMLGAAKQPNESGYASDVKESGWQGTQWTINQTMGDQPLQCVRGGADECQGANLKLGPPPAGGFPNTPEGHKAFIEWLKPLALYIQATTGLPSSVLIAQASTESSYGTSEQFRKHNALFGHSCWKPNTQQSGTIHLGSTDQTYTGYCGAPRPANEGGYYLIFPNAEQSVLAYVSNLLGSGLYKNLAAECEQAKDSVPPHPASCYSVIDSLGGYAANGGYQSLLKKVVSSNDLTKYDSGVCQGCLSAKGSSTGYDNGNSGSYQ